MNGGIYCKEIYRVPGKLRQNIMDMISDRQRQKNAKCKGQDMMQGNLQSARKTEVK